MTANNENQEKKKAAQPVAAAPVNLDSFDWDAYEHDLGVYNDSKENIEAKYDQTLSKVQVGEVVEGTVIGLNKREVVVNIGYKSEGIIPIGASTAFVGSRERGPRKRRSDQGLHQVPH